MSHGRTDRLRGRLDHGALGLPPGRHFRGLRPHPPWRLRADGALDHHAVRPRPSRRPAPGACISLCGVNDIGRNEGVFVPVEEICRTLAGMLDEARALGVKAWIGSLTPVDGIPWNPEVRDAPAMIAAVNAWLRDHAHEHGATFIDYHAVLVSESGGLRPDYGTDGLHLSPAGYAAIEPLMLRALGRIPDAPSAPALSVNGAPANTARSVRARLIGSAVAAAALLAAIAALVLELR
ncbi:MAG: GDSL-type esterase/lipase family protein [Methylobacterium radiotolerans]